MARNPVVFQNGTLVSNAKVEVGGTIYDVTPAEYEGTTPLSANNLNQLQTNLYDYVDEEKTTSFTTDGSGVKTNMKIDNNFVYVKRIFCETLPNNTSKTFDLGIDLSTHTIIKLEGYCKSKSNNVGFPLPFTNVSTLGLSIGVNITNDNKINIATGNDRSNYNAWFNVYYI